MKGLQISSGVILLMTAGFLTQQIIMVSSAAMNITCELMSEGFIANPASCQEYGYCKGGKLIGTGKCPNGYLYNLRTGVCDVPSNVKCIDVNTVCQYADLTYIADPSDCSRYCYCINKKAECTTCPESQVFDIQNTMCVYPSQTVCGANQVCQLVPNGVFLAAETCGENYIGCLNGVDNPGQCPNNLFYNKELGGCQSANPCIGNSPVGGGLGVNNPPPEIPTPCANSGATPATPKFVTDQQTCMGYYVCTSNEDPGTWTKCPLGLHFNKGECVTPYTFPCEYDRCGNLNQSFVGTINSNCKGYVICKDQTTQPTIDGSMSCINNLFFNEFTMSCTQQNPATTNYKLC